MKLTHIIKEEDGRKMTVNTIGWDGHESDEMQLSIMQHDDEAFIDLRMDEAVKLRDKITEWISA